MNDNYIVQILNFLYGHWLLTMIFLLFLPNNHVNIDWKIGHTDSKYNSPCGLNKTESEGGK